MSNKVESLDDVRPVVKRFALRMEEVLRDNDHKTGWLDMQPDELVGRLEQELDELYEAIYKRAMGEISAEEFEREGVDVANFAMMVVDRVEWKIGEKR